MKASELKTLIKERVKEILKEQDTRANYKEYNDGIDEIYNSFLKLEKEYNSYDLVQLKQQYKLSLVLDKAEELEKEFNKLRDKFEKLNAPEGNRAEEERHGEIDDQIFHLREAIDDFVGDLQTMTDLFKEMGDLDKGSVYFKKLNL